MDRSRSARAVGHVGSGRSSSSAPSSTGVPMKPGGQVPIARLDLADEPLGRLSFISSGTRSRANARAYSVCPVFLLPSQMVPSGWTNSLTNAAADLARQLAPLFGVVGLANRLGHFGHERGTVVIVGRAMDRRVLRAGQQQASRRTRRPAGGILARFGQMIHEAATAWDSVARPRVCRRTSRTDGTCNHGRVFPGRVAVTEDRGGHVRIRSVGPLPGPGRCPRATAEERGHIAIEGRRLHEYLGVAGPAGTLVALRTVGRKVQVVALLTQ